MNSSVSTPLPPTHITKDFKKSEMACKCGCGDSDMDAGFMQNLQTLRELCGFPLVINSGKRCAKHNKAEGGAKDSAHLYGKAADIKCAGAQAHTILRIAMRLNFTGIGIAQKLGSDPNARYIHLDVLEPGLKRPTIWSY